MSEFSGHTDQSARLHVAVIHGPHSVIRVKMVLRKAAMTMYPPERQRAITNLLIEHDGRRATVTQISEQLESHYRDGAP